VPKFEVLPDDPLKRKILYEKLSRPYSLAMKKD